MNIKPLSDHILIEPIKEEEKTKSGIFLPDTAQKEKPEQGIVIAVGQGKKTDDGKIVPVSVKPGDKVLFTKYGPNEIKIDGREYLIAREDDILAVIEDNSKDDSERIEQERMKQEIEQNRRDIVRDKKSDAGY